MNWLEFLQPVVLALVGILTTYIIRKMKLSGDTKETVEFIGEKVNKIFRTYVEGHKAANGGKLKQQEKEEARRLLWDEVKNTAKGPVLKLVTKWGQDRVQAYAERFISANKKPKK